MAKVDPRVDPTSLPPKEGVGDNAVDHLKLPRDMLSAPRIASDPSVEPIGSGPESASPRSASTVTNRDPRYEPIEKLLDANDWRAVSAELGSLDDAGKLPPNLGIVASRSFSIGS